MANPVQVLLKTGQRSMGQFIGAFVQCFGLPWHLAKQSARVDGGFKKKATPSGVALLFCAVDLVANHHFAAGIALCSGDFQFVHAV